MVDNVDPRPDVKEGHMKQYASKVFCPAPFLHGYLKIYEFKISIIIIFFKNPFPFFRGKERFTG